MTPAIRPGRSLLLSAGRGAHHPYGDNGDVRHANEPVIPGVGNGFLDGNADGRPHCRDIWIARLGTGDRSGRRSNGLDRERPRSVSPAPTAMGTRRLATAAKFPVARRPVRPATGECESAGPRDLQRRAAVGPDLGLDQSAAGLQIHFGGRLPIRLRRYSDALPSDPVGDEAPAVCCPSRSVLSRRVRLGPAGFYMRVLVAGEGSQVVLSTAEARVPANTAKSRI
jgi:hypothetical protein